MVEVIQVTGILELKDGQADARETRPSKDGLLAHDISP